MLNIVIDLELMNDTSDCY